MRVLLPYLTAGFPVCAKWIIEIGDERKIMGNCKAI